jgi:dipeptidyl aminopeptidase/acylaminoacyl peptidase
VILHGVRDDVVPIETSRRFVADRPHVRLIELDDGHELLATLPEILDVVAAAVTPG